MRVLIGLVVLSGVSALLAANGRASPALPIAIDRHAASVAGQQLLGDVVLPAGATPEPQEPAGDARQLASPDIDAFFAAEVDRQAFWTTPVAPGTVLASFTAHLPSGAKLVTSFSSGGSVGAAYALGTDRRFVVGPEQLMLKAVSLNDGLTGVRADAQVRYRSPRPPSQRVPVAARLVLITKAYIGARPLVSLVMTRQSVVRTLARLLDALPFVARITGAFSCPAFNGLTDTFTFRATPAGPALATVSESAYTPTFPSPCALTMLTIRGHRLTPLLNGGILLRQAGKLVGVQLTG